MDIVRNDKISVEDVAKYDKILLSPGPGIPSEAGIMLDIIRKYGEEKSIFGVCLGHQGIAEVYGAKLFNLPEVIHGQAVPAEVIEKDDIFTEVPEKINVGRYHSWSIDPSSDLTNFIITARDIDGNIMAVKHKEFNVRGVQFHPESILTEFGKKMLDNWLKN